MTPVDPEMQGRLVVVTGAGGFLGSHVVSALERAGYRLRSLTGPPGGHLEAPVWHGEDQVEADICDRVVLRRLLDGADAVVHLAGPPSVAESFTTPEEWMRVHALGTSAVLEACRATGVRRLVYVSSAEVYGRVEGKFVGETHRLRPRSPYAAAKISAEALVRVYANSLEMDAIILRPFSVYGPGASPQSLLSELTRKIVSGVPVVVRDLRPVRDYVFVEDVAAAILAATSLEVGRGLRICNVGTMVGTSVAELGTQLLEVFGRRGLVMEESAGRRPEQSEIFRLVSDNRCARALLGWSPQVGLREGLTRLAKAAHA